MSGILDAAVEADRRLEDAGAVYCLIGGIALQRWGQPRTTLDVDVIVMADFGREPAVIEHLLRLFPARIADAGEFALKSRVLLLKTSLGVGVDISLGALPYEARMVRRSSRWAIDARRSLRTCSAEDLIVQKAFAARDQDWVDVQRVVERQARNLDRDLILKELEPLAGLKEDTESLERLRRLLGLPHF